MIQIDIDMPKRCINCPLCKHVHLVDSPLLIYACGKGMRPIYSHETEEGVDEFCKMQKPDWCPLKEVEPLTDKEQRIFLSAMSREEKVCKEVDADHIREAYEDTLVFVCNEITRKVKKALWK